MAKKRSGPTILTQAHYDQIDGSLRKMADLVPIMASAEVCDVDCAEYRNAHQYLTASLAKIKQHFFPHGRPAG